MTHKETCILRKVEMGIGVPSKFCSEKVLRRLQILIQIRIHRIHMLLGLLDPDPDPDPLVKGMDPDPSIIKQK